MKRNRYLLGACCSGLMLAASGCATTGLPTASPNASSPSRQAMSSPQTMSSPSRQPGTAARPPAGSPWTASVAQVGYTAPTAQPMMHSTAGSCGCNHCGDTGGATAPAAPQTMFGAIPYGCGPANASQAPYGYAVPYGAMWNAYGADPQEFICDGGDHPPEAVPLRNGGVAGLQGEDTVVRYRTEDGYTEVKESNRVCLYSPRFSSVRKVTSALAGGRSLSLAQVDRPVGAERVHFETPGLTISDTTELAHADVTRRIDAMRERNRGVPIEAIQALEQTGEVLAAYAGLSFTELRQLEDEQMAQLQRLALAAVTWELDESVEVVVEDLRPSTLTRDQQLQGLTVYEFPDEGRLQILKMADRSEAKSGDIVNFVLRVENVGDSAASDVLLIDNLTTRLEYVPQSEQSDVDASFEAVENAQQSLKLTWKLEQPLEVGESATIRFQCKVR